MFGILRSPSQAYCAVQVLRLGIGNGRLVLRSHIPALHAQRARDIDADERPSTRDLLGIILDRPLIERGKCCFDFAKPLIDLLGQLIGVGMGLLELLILCPQAFGGSDLLFAHRDRLASYMPQSVRVAIWKVGGDLQPFPALGPDGFGRALELLGNKSVEKHGVLRPAAIVLLEEIAHDCAAG
jgi:hypothetical protein